MNNTQNSLQCYLGLHDSYLTQDHVINAVTAVVTADPSAFQLNVST